MARQELQGQISKVGVLLSATAALWLMLAPVLGHMGKPWPCFIVGTGVLASLLMAWRRPDQRRGWSLLVVVLSATILLIGSSAIAPAALGITGGVFIVARSNESETDA